MRKLALPDEILMSIEKPARYIGGEINHVKKNPDDVDIRFAMCFPDVYEIGMSHLGIQILYDMLNRREDTWCERVYSPWADLDKVMREKKIPLFALESQDPLKCFDFLGITIQYEMCYTNILQVIDLAGIPIWARERTEGDPIVIGGGPCTYNPEPIAEFFDIIYIGEGEVVYDRLLDLYKQCKDHFDRHAFLHAAAKIPGLYVPSLYEVSYHTDGTVSGFAPVYEDIPSKIEKQVVMDMGTATYPEKPLVPFIKVTQDRAVLEIMRGCIRGCRFCQAGMIYRPVRNRSLEDLKRYAKAMIDSTGYEEISLSSLSSSDFTELPELINFLIEEMGERKVNISLPSLRIDAFSLDVMRKVQDIKKTSLTFAPEAGTQKQRNVINKGLTEEDIINGARQAFIGGWNKVKLYFMLGQPFETYDDIEGIAKLSELLAEVYYETVPKEQRTGGPVAIHASASFFVPKPFTPFQWATMDTMESFTEKAHFVKDKFKEQLNHKRLKFQYHAADISLLEGILARGDRRLSKVIYEVYQNGGIYDAWSEFYSHTRWMDAFDKYGIDTAFYLTRERREDEIFPWDFIDIGVSKQFLQKEWNRAKEGVVTPNCRMLCSGCGAARFGGGVCFEVKN